MSRFPYPPAPLIVFSSYSRSQFLAGILVTLFLLSCWSIEVNEAEGCVICYDERRCPLKNRHLQMADTKCIEECLERCHRKTIPGFLLRVKQQRL